MNLIIKDFIDKYYLHFNARELKDAAKAYSDHIENGGKMLITLAGAMSTAQLGKVLAEMIRQDKIHAISCTGANLEEDLFNLVANKSYKKVPNYKDLTPEQELKLNETKFNRVTDTCIPEEEAINKISKYVIDVWQKAQKEKKKYFPHEFLYQVLDNKDFYNEAQIDLKESWLIAAYKKKLPIYVPGWEDSSLGSVLVANNNNRNNISLDIVKNGLNYMNHLIDWYKTTSKDSKIGFFQIGGGIAGDFPICVVPLINQDINDGKVPLWSYFCQISDSTTSYGSYSGAVPNEKITWGKLNLESKKFMIESDATIVAPLIFSYVLNW
ncbi:MAG: deoxyhypusine synthase family protein [Bacteroidetes bacterium]|nr:deoxyhypusine synthase family protein [Bacteroidota bacterium]